LVSFIKQLQLQLLVFVTLSKVQLQSHAVLLFISYELALLG